VPRHGDHDARESNLPQPRSSGARRWSDYYLGHATERIFCLLLKLTIPEIVDYHTMPAEGIFHNLVFVSIKKEYPGQAQSHERTVGQGLMSLRRCSFIVDDWVDVQNTQEAWWVALNNIDPSEMRALPWGRWTCSTIRAAVHLWIEDGLDATRKLPEEGFIREWPGVIAMSRRREAGRRRQVNQLGLGEVRRDHCRVRIHVREVRRSPGRPDG